MAFIHISKLIQDIEKYTQKYEDLIEEHQDFFNMEGKKLEYICKTLPKLVQIFKQGSYELKTFQDAISVEKERIEGDLWKRYVEGSKRHMAPKDIQMYIQQEKDWIDICQLSLEINHVKNKIQAILDALDVAHWQMNNITKIRIAALEEEVL